MKLKHMIILQNKIDLVKETQAKEQHEQILRFVKGKRVLAVEKKLTKNLKFEAQFVRDTTAAPQVPVNVFSRVKPTWKKLKRMEMLSHNFLFIEIQVFFLKTAQRFYCFLIAQNEIDSS